ncbi:MAG: SDR family NAD(P)-dependent oxidoreductase, partial [Deltaproteobacteria bacterium]|nr:SDR family NAD(P)-dependent oxidoreductase [Deltaproteobacteria bacterium]
MTNDAKRVVVVTGGSRGIGRSIGLRMADLNTRVYFNYSAADSTDAEETERLVEDAGGSAKGARVNVASRQEVQEFFNHIVKECGRVDVLVNNAGITEDGLMVRMKEENWDRVLGINLKGAFLCTQAVAKT